MAEQVDAADLKSVGIVSRAGSTPAERTIYSLALFGFQQQHFFRSELR